MKASDLIMELQARIDLFGDWNVLMRIGGIEDIDVGLVYGDDEAEQIIISE